MSAAKEQGNEKSIWRALFEKLAVGGTAGVIARTTVAPIDRVKILMQTSHLLEKGSEQNHKSILQSFRNIIKEEGVTALWRGNMTNCIRVIPHSSTQFFAYDTYKDLILGYFEKQNLNRASEDQIKPNGIVVRLVAGALSGMTAATVTHPMDVMRIRLQTQRHLTGFWSAAKSVHAENGLRTFYKGYIPAMLSLSPFIAINFAANDTLKKFYFGAEDRDQSKDALKNRNPFISLLLGAASGIIAQTFCYPLDTVRRRMQLAGKNYNGTIDAFRTILRVEGLGGFYKGMSANALKVVPNMAIRFAAFDVLKAFIMPDNKNTKKIDQGEKKFSQTNQAEAVLQKYASKKQVVA